MASLSDLFASPDLYPFAIEQDHLLLLGMDRTAYARSIFLDRRIDPAERTPRGVPLDALLREPAPAPLRAGWIFHVAHCGSTLLARALDRADGGLVLREPLALRQMAVWGVEGAAASPEWQAMLGMLKALLSRRARPDAATVIKANVPVNFILDALLAGNEPAAFLYHRFDDYLLAVLRGPNHRRWVESVTAELRPAVERLAGPVEGLADAERAAALWLSQLRAFDAALGRLEGGRSLDAELFYAAPAEVLSEAFRLFGAEVDGAEVEAIAGGELFGSYSKNRGARFDNQARVERRETLRKELAPELEQARGWLERRMADFPLPERLGKPLVKESPALL